MVQNMILASAKTMHRTQKALTWTLFVTCISAHTWIEQTQVIGADGSYVGDYGYARGFVERANPLFDGYANKWQIPDPRFDVGLTRMNESMLACHPSQRTSNYSSAYPKLQVVPGDFVAMKYLENGHVTRSWDPEGKPQLGGTVWVYATYKPKEDETLSQILRWDASGTAGNGDGWLMAAQDFDDGRCYQINTSPESSRRRSVFPNHPTSQPGTETEQWCETNILVNDQVQVNSTITIYWVWGWETAHGTKDIPCGKDEYYTSCLDFEVVDGSLRNLQNITLPNTHTISQQDPQPEAVHAYRSRRAVRKTPSFIAEEACGNQSDMVSTSTSPNTETITGTGALAKSVAPPQSPTRATVDLEHKYTPNSAEEQDVTVRIVKSTTITTTITTTVTPTITIKS
jgi:hypothetical protein